MRIKKVHHRKLYVTVVILILAICGYGLFAHHNSLWPFLPTIIAPPTQPQEINSDKYASNSTNNDTDIPAKQTPKQYETPDDKTNAPTSSIVGTLNTNLTNNTLQIRVTVPQLLGTGHCTLTLTRGGDTLTKNAAVVNNPSTSSCGGWDVPLSNLSSGTWNIDVLITSGDKSGHITGEVDI